MKDLQTIQKLIEEKALSRFNKDYWEAVNPIINSKLFKGARFPFMIAEQLHNESVYWFFREGCQSGFYQKLKDAWLPQYVGDESKSFFNKVESLRKDVDSLLENQYHPHDNEY